MLCVPSLVPIGTTKSSQVPAATSVRPPLLWTLVHGWIHGREREILTVHGPWKRALSSERERERETERVLFVFELCARWFETSEANLIFSGLGSLLADTCR